MSVDRSTWDHRDGENLKKKREKKTINQQTSFALLFVPRWRALGIQLVLARLSKVQLVDPLANGIDRTGGFMILSIHGPFFNSTPASRGMTADLLPMNGVQSSKRPLEYY